MKRAVILFNLGGDLYCFPGQLQSDFSEVFYLDTIWYLYLRNIRWNPTISHNIFSDRSNFWTLWQEKSRSGCDLWIDRQYLCYDYCSYCKCCPKYKLVPSWWWSFSKSFWTSGFSCFCVHGCLSFGSIYWCKDFSFLEKTDQRKTFVAQEQWLNNYKPVGRYCSRLDIIMLSWCNWVE